MNKVGHILQVKITLKELQVRNELLILRNLEAFQVLLLEKLEHYGLLMIQLLFTHLFFLYLLCSHTTQRSNRIYSFKKLCLLDREHCKHVLYSG